jgi:hypothetical protein
VFGDSGRRVDGCGVVNAGGESEGCVSLNGVADGDYCCLWRGR